MSLESPSYLLNLHTLISSIACSMVSILLLVPQEDLSRYWLSRIDPLVLIAPKDF